MLQGAFAEPARARSAPTRPPSHAGTSGPARAPSGPSLVEPASEGSGSEETLASGRPQPDPLVSNGLGSPSCTSTLGLELTGASRRDCETSGFAAAGAPTGNFGLDVHIDTGLIPLSGSSLMSAIQDIFIAPVWLAVVWLVHVLVVMLEWSFGLNLFEGASSRSLQVALSHLSSALTAPLLGLALSLAGTLIAYHGLVRRRVGQTLGEALTMMAMIAGGVWLMVDPAGTVGALSSWSGEAGLGTLAASARGAPAAPGRALADSMSAVFAAAVEAPWCYLEFGNVAWCREPPRLDHALHQAGLGIAAAELREAGCGRARERCALDATKSGLLGSARLLEEARTNGDEFLALPTNGPQRNSINDPSSLLRALCRSSDATACKGPDASEAEFRTNSGTWPRVGGLMLIAIGLLGMMLLLGFIALRLLLAAILSVFYLLLTPGIVLLPALGETGRGLFRAWAVRLLGAVAAKLVFAFLLGVVLAVMALLDGLQGLGWWAQWMLLAAFWWGAFLKRHEVLQRTPRAGATVDLSAHKKRVREWRSERRDRQPRHRRNRERNEPDRADDAGFVASRGRVNRGQARSEGPDAPRQRDEQARRLLASTAMLAGGQKSAALSGLAASRSQLGRVRDAKRAAVAGRDTRRAALLAAREARLEDVAARHSKDLALGEASLASHRDRRIAASDLESTTALLDRESTLPGMLERPAGRPARDYPALAGLVGLTESRYRTLGPAGQRKARLAIDRELSIRRQRRGLRREERPLTDDPQTPARARTESPVMRDARAVAEGRKRELGFDRS